MSTCAQIVRLSLEHNCGVDSGLMVKSRHLVAVMLSRIIDELHLV